jgi:hypothetical protein
VHELLAAASLEQRDLRLRERRPSGGDDIRPARFVECDDVEVALDEDGAPGRADRPLRLGDPEEHLALPEDRGLRAVQVLRFRLGLASEPERPAAEADDPPVEPLEGEDDPAPEPVVDPSPVPAALAQEPGLEELGLLEALRLERPLEVVPGLRRESEAEAPRGRLVDAARREVAPGLLRTLDAGAGREGAAPLRDVRGTRRGGRESSPEEVGVRRSRQSQATSVPVVKIGGLYRDRTSGLLVTAEDHEIRGGRRTGRVLARAVDTTLRFPLWLSCRGEDLVEAEDVSAAVPAPAPEDGGAP